METHGLICPHDSHSASHSTALHDTWSRIKWNKLMQEASSDFYVHRSLSPSLVGRQPLSPHPLQALVCWSMLTRGLPSPPQALSGSICWFRCNTTPTRTYSKLLLWCPWVERWRVTFPSYFHLALSFYFHLPLLSSVSCPGGLVVQRLKSIDDSQLRSDGICF